MKCAETGICAVSCVHSGWAEEFRHHPERNMEWVDVKRRRAFWKAEMDEENRDNRGERCEPIPLSLSP